MLVVTKDLLMATQTEERLVLRTVERMVLLWGNLTVDWMVKELAALMALLKALLWAVVTEHSKVD